MGCVHKKHMAFARSRFFQQRLQLGFQKGSLGSGMLLDGLFRRQGNGGEATPFQAKHFFKKARTCVGLRSTPVSSLIRWHASATVWGGSLRNDSSSESRCCISSLT